MALPYTDPIPAWAAPAVTGVTVSGLMRGDGGQFRPADPITRAEAAAVAMRQLVEDPVGALLRGTLISMATVSAATGPGAANMGACTCVRADASGTYLVTAKHVVRGCSAIVLLPYQDPTRQLSAVIAEEIPGVDAALLRLTQPWTFRPVRRASEEELALDLRHYTRVWCIGSQSYRHGVAVELRLIGPELGTVEGETQMLHAANGWTTGGQSGGAVVRWSLDGQARLLGVLSATQGDNDHPTSMSLMAPVSAMPERWFQLR